MKHIYFLLAGLLNVASAQQVSNGGFEAGVSGWSSGAAVVKDNQAHGGAAYAFGQDLSFSQVVSTSAQSGVTYSIYYWTRLDKTWERQVVSYVAKPADQGKTVAIKFDLGSSGLDDVLLETSGNTSIKGRQILDGAMRKVLTLPGRVVVESPLQGDITVSLYNTRGSLIKSWSASSQESVWDGRDRSGRLVKGLVMIRLQNANAMQLVKYLAP